MKNEFGVELDRNGYAPSIVQQSGLTCSLCYRTDRPLQRHEVFHGPYRTKSKNLGCWVLLCEPCHMRLHHGDKAGERWLKQITQAAAMKAYGWTVQQFIERFGKNYVEVDD